MKYTDGTEYKTNSGSLIRFAGMITAIGRMNLYRAMIAIDKIMVSLGYNID